MKVSRTVSYAVQAIVQLAQADRGATVPCSRLASQGKMPERFLLQILRNLVTHGVLQSTRGVEGGYALTRDPTEISLLEVIEAIEGPMTAGVATGETPESQTRLRQALRDVTNITRRELEAIKVSHLIPKPPSRAPRS